MHFAFRADASLQIGTGHVMRCITLADALHKRGAKSSFLCRPHSGHLLDLICQRGHTAIELGPADESFTAPAKPAHAQWLGTEWALDAEQTKQALSDQLVDWLVVDHYALDYRWEQDLAPYCAKLMVIDDLADRLHVCDLLLDQTFGRDAESYHTLVPADCRLLCGSQYALLRPEFAALRKQSLQRRAKPTVKELLVNMGGVDKDNATARVLDELRGCTLPANCRITVVMGGAAPWLDEVKTKIQDMPWRTRILENVDNMAQLMANSDLAIGAAGATSWERCCLGLPSIVLTIAENQRLIMLQLSMADAVLEINFSSSNHDQQLNHAIEKCINPSELSKMSRIASNITDGEGAIRVQSILYE